MIKIMIGTLIITTEPALAAPAETPLIVAIAELKVLSCSDQTYPDAPAFHTYWKVVTRSVSHAGLTSGITICQ